MPDPDAGPIPDARQFRDEVRDYAESRWPRDFDMRAWFMRIAFGPGEVLDSADLEWAAQQVRQIEAARQIPMEGV